VQAAEQSAGYTAPEVDLTGQYTLKSDVYSFGVVMLELMTGRRPFDRYTPIIHFSFFLILYKCGN